jgi:hypothetical protein
MKPLRLITRWLPATTIAFVLSGIACLQPAKAERAVFLLDLKCVHIKGNWGGENRDISVGRNYHLSKMDMYSGNGSASFTCKLPPNPGSLWLEFGIEDSNNDSTPVMLIIS